MMKLNKFNTIFCSLLTVGFIFGGCTSLNNYENDTPAIQKPAVTKTRTQLLAEPAPISYEPLEEKTSISYAQLAKIPKGLDKSVFYLNNDVSPDGNKLINYKKFSFSERDYLSNGGEQKVTREQAREQLLKSFGLENSVLSGKIFHGNTADLRIRPYFNPISGDSNFIIIYTINY